jgi:hypothetical protein
MPVAMNSLLSLQESDIKARKDGRVEGWKGASKTDGERASHLPFFHPSTLPSFLIPDS